MTTLKSKIEAIKNITAFTSKIDFWSLSSLLKNVKSLVNVDSSSDARIQQRVLTDSFLDEGTCVTDEHCGGTAQGTCQRINSTDAKNLRKSCNCEANFAGTFCQQKKAILEEYNPNIVAIVIKIGTYLNQTGAAKPNITEYADFLFYKEILYYTLDFIGVSSRIAFQSILQRIQPLAQTPDDISTITQFYRRNYNGYWNKYNEYQVLPDKSISTQAEKSLYEIARVSIIQNAK